MSSPLLFVQSFSSNELGSSFNIDNEIPLSQETISNAEPLTSAELNVNLTILTQKFNSSSGSFVT